MESNNEGSPTETDQYHSFVQNIRATLAAFLSTLKRYDVMPIEAYGKPFDPTQHEAIGQVESA